MINVDLTEEEFNLIINYRKGKYNLDITEEEYNKIMSRRDSLMKTYEKYIQNIKKLVDENNSFVSKKASVFFEAADKLHKKNISLADYKLIEDVIYTGEDENIKFKVKSLNYIKNAIALHYPN